MGISLEDWLIHHEGMKTRLYKCSADKTSIGAGRNLQDNGISLDEAYYLLRNDIKRCKKELEIYAWYQKSPPGVKDALINMCFNMGVNRLRTFKKMIAALDSKNYHLAALEALDSDWQAQVGKRAKDVAAVIRAGV